MYKEIMERSRLRDKFLRTRSHEDMLKFNKQRRFCKKLLITAKGLYFSNLHLKKVVDNRSFWKSFSTFFHKIFKR